MTSSANIFPLVFPALVVCLAVILVCLYQYARKKRAAYDLAIARQQDENTSIAVFTISLSEDQAEMDRHDIPPPYSPLGDPPPYALFDPKLTSVRPVDSLPAYEMNDITPHHQMTTTAPASSSESSTHNHP